MSGDEGRATTSSPRPTLVTFIRTMYEDKIASAWVTPSLDSAPTVPPYLAGVEGILTP